jgi:hypothetical protein
MAWGPSAALVVALCTPALAQEVRTAAVLEFEFIDDMQDYEHADVKDAQLRRITLASDALRKDLAERALYRIVDLRAAAGMIADFKARQELRDCTPCEMEIGRALGADVIIIGWVQKVSNLILNVNIEVKEVSSGQTLYRKSVDLRGNTDDSWLRAIHFMADRMAEDKQQLR